MIGFALTGSFCTISQSLSVLRELTARYDVLPIVSPSVCSTDTRFARAADTLATVTELCGRPPVLTISEAEPLGPARPLEALVICPCTGNTLAKIANGITDTCVTMAAKAHMRNDRPLIIALASNDALRGNLRNLATLLNCRQIFFVPFGQDDPQKKPHSLISDFSLTLPTLEKALLGKQLQPLLLR